MGWILDSMSTMTKRTKLIIGAVLTVSLACNVFFLGWLAGTSPLMPGPWVGRLGEAAGLIRSGTEPNLSPEQRLVDFLARGLSEAGRRKILNAVESRTLDIRNLERQAAGIRADIVALMLKPEPDRGAIEKRVQEYEQTMQRRISTLSDSILPVIFSLGMEDRRLFVERWARGPGGPPPPPPPSN